MNSFIDILRAPDGIKIMTEETPFRFEEGEANPTKVKLDFVVKNNALNVIIEPTQEKIKWIRLRWRGDFSKVRSVWHDGFERSDNIYFTEMTWSAPRAQEMMPWNFVAVTTNNVEYYHDSTLEHKICDLLDSYNIDYIIFLRRFLCFK